MAEYLKRLEYLIGNDELNSLGEKKVMVCGVGGVGSFVCEALARSGIGKLVIVDFDAVDVTNLNRQLFTTKDNINMIKVFAMRKRLAAISDCEVEAINTFIDDKFIVADVDYVVDCVDILSAKFTLFKQCLNKGIPIISSMGSANRLRADKVCVSTLDKTRNDPLARNYRQLCRKEKLDASKLRVVFLDQEAMKVKIINEKEKEPKKRYPLGSSIFAVGAVGLKLAEIVFTDLIN